MNVRFYFLSSPTFAKPPMVVHAVVDPPDPDELAALMDLWQNPTYPEDAYLTEDQFNTEARDKTRQRAQSPSVHLCLLESVDSFSHPIHAHTYSECFQYREGQVIKTSDPWTYWSEYDVFPHGPARIIIPPPLPPRGWYPLARVNPSGISQMNGWVPGWTNFTFATQIGGSKILRGYGPGTRTRVMISAQCVFGALYVGASTDLPFKSDQVHQLTFGGSATNIAVNASFSDAGSGMPYTRVSDPLPEGIDAPNGLVISGYVASGSPPGTTAWLTTRGVEPDWTTRWSVGNHAADLDKTNLRPGVSGAWQPGGVSDYAVLWVEAYYP